MSARCRHASQLGPYHTPCAVRVWFYCQDCGRWGSRYTRTDKKQRIALKWSYLTDPVRDVPKLSRGLPFAEFL